MLGTRLRAAMELREMTQGQLEVKTETLGNKVAQSYISRIIRGEQMPAWDIVVVLARALDVSLDWLAGLPPREKGVLTPDEEELLRLYRALEMDMRATLLDVARSLTGTKRG